MMLLAYDCGPGPRCGRFGARGLVTGYGQNDERADKDRHEYEWNNISTEFAIHYVLLCVVKSETIRCQST
jgi:hypothetical protein